MKSPLFAALLLLTVAGPLLATTYAPISLPELVKISDTILAGHVVNVRMTDQSGKEITDREARTGPGLGNTISLDVMVDHKLILKSPGTPIPKEICIPLDPLRQMSLGQSQTFFMSESGGKSFFFLDKTFRPAHPGEFQLPVEEQKKLESIIRRLSKP